MRLWLHIAVLLLLWGVLTVVRAQLTVPWTFSWYLAILASATTMVWVGYILGRHDLLGERRRRR